jgi:hypothetical protein
MTDQQGPEGTPAPSTEPVAPPPLAPYVNQAPPPQPPPIMQPAATWAAPPPAMAPRAGRSGLAAGASGILIVLGILGLILGVLAFAGTAFFSQLAGDLGGTIPGLPEGTDAGDIIAGAFAFVAVIIIAYSLVYIIGGIGVWRGTGWGRGIGLTVAILSGLFWLAGLSGGGERGGLVFVAIMLALHAYVFFVLAFRYRDA